MKNTIKVKVEAKEIPQRMDIFLSLKTDLTRSQIQKHYKAGKILINKKPAKKIGEKIKPQDKIEILPLEKTPAKKINIRKKQIKIPKVKILTETSDYLIIEKPWGLLTHELPGKEEASLSQILASKYPEIKKVGDNPKSRAGIVHRLDKEASGVLVVARNQKMFDSLKKQFKKRTVEKEYYALVHGKILADTGLIDFPIERSKKQGKMTSIPKIIKGVKTESGREALTEFEVIQRFVNFTLVKVKIHTGRTNQIRVHFLAYNHPLVGDPLYFQKKQKKTWDNKLGRLFLHSHFLSFTDLKKQKVEFKSELPKKLKDFLKELK